MVTNLMLDYEEATGKDWERIGQISKDSISEKLEQNWDSLQQKKQQHKSR